MLHNNSAAVRRSSVELNSSAPVYRSNLEIKRSALVNRRSLKIKFSVLIHRHLFETKSSALINLSSPMNSAFLMVCSSRLKILLGDYITSNTLTKFLMLASISFTKLNGTSTN